MTSIADSVLRAIGGTPVVRLRRVVPAGDADVIIKLESLNPTGSYKDRMALAAGGADPTLTLQNGATPVMIAAGMGVNPNESRRGIAVIDFGKVEPEGRVLDTMRVLVALGADVNARNQAGDTAMHTVAALGYDTVVQLLADHGAEINAKNARGLTPLGRS